MHVCTHAHELARSCTRRPRFANPQLLRELVAPLPDMEGLQLGAPVALRVAVPLQQQHEAAAPVGAVADDLDRALAEYEQSKANVQALFFEKEKF